MNRLSTSPLLPCIFTIMISTPTAMAQYAFRKLEVLSSGVEIEDLSINNLGDVAYRLKLAPVYREIRFVNSTGPSTLVASSTVGPGTVFLGTPQINDAKQIGFQRSETYVRWDSPSSSTTFPTFIGNAPSPETTYDVTDLNAFNIDGQFSGTSRTTTFIPSSVSRSVFRTTDSGIEHVSPQNTAEGFYTSPMMNNNGDLAYAFQNFAQGGLIGKIDSFGASSVLFASTPFNGGIGLVDFNDSSQALFVYTSNAASFSSYFITDGITTRRVLGDRTGFASLDADSLNNNGDLLAWGVPLDADYGFYLQASGSNELKRLIGAGDTLFGSIVTEVTTSNTLSDNNQIAIAYRLANGEHGIAIMVPEISTLCLASISTSLLLLGLVRKRCGT